MCTAAAGSAQISAATKKNWKVALFGCETVPSESGNSRRQVFCPDRTHAALVCAHAAVLTTAHASLRTAVERSGGAVANAATFGAAAEGASASRAVAREAADVYTWCL